MSTTVQENSLFEIDRELDLLLDEIQEEAQEKRSEEVRVELVARFQEFCDAYTEKVDRIGHFLSLMESRSVYCRAQAARLTERARLAESKAERTKSMVLYYLRSRDLRKIEGREFT
jgi:cob(I)alamin adenosyltransferase